MEKLFKDTPSFKNVYVKGEVSGKYISPRGHLYFTLKDNQSQVPCIVYQWFQKNIGFEIEDGMKLLVTANITVYWPHGKYQLDVRSATDEGLGKLFLAYKQLRKKLESEGLFKKEHKKPLPEFPKRIGVVTSRGGSVIHDIIKTVDTDWPYCEVILFPASVQGASSKMELVSQIKRADSFGIDVLIVARGGGSIEDLWSYNEEEVVRTIFDCKTPVISAIGHEDDVTLSDLVADKRASTPTMAASLAIKNREDVKNHINHLNSRLITFISTKLDENKREFENILKKDIFTDSAAVYGSKKIDFDLLHNRFDVVSNEILTINKHELSKIKSSYSIRHPCKMQLDSSKHKLNELKNRLLDAMDSIINNNRVNLDKATAKFNFQSEKIITSEMHRLDKIKKSYFIQNPCKMQLDYSKSQLNMINVKLSGSIGDIYDSRNRNFDDLNNRFKSKSHEIILTNSYRVNSIKSLPILKNGLNNYLEDNHYMLNDLNSRSENSFNQIINDNKKELSIVLDKKIIKNPFLILDDYKLKLGHYEEKLDKINQMIILEKEKRDQKSRMIKIIVAIVAVFIIIILLLVFGGI